LARKLPNLQAPAAAPNRLPSTMPITDLTEHY
jgi:hypothetical protein